jgi:hypothetical protein
VNVSLPIAAEIDTRLRHHRQPGHAMHVRHSTDADYPHAMKPLARTEAGTPRRYDGDGRSKTTELLDGQCSRSAQMFHWNAMIGENDGFTREAIGGVMQDRDSFYCRAIRTRLGDAQRAQQESVATDRKEPNRVGRPLRTATAAVLPTRQTSPRRRQ